MSKTSVITARLDEETLASLDRLSAAQERSRAWLIAKAVQCYVRGEIAFLDFVQQGTDEIERGDFLTHEELVAEIEAATARKNAA